MGDRRNGKPHSDHEGYADKNLKNAYEWSNIINGAVIEFVGSMILTFITLVAYQTIFLSSKNPPLSATALAIGFGHFLVVYTFTGGSSGFFNPLMTICVVSSWVPLKKCSKEKAFNTIWVYIIAQIIGSFVGGLGILLLLGYGNIGTPVAAKDINEWRVWYMQVLISMFYTAMCMCQCLKKKMDQETTFQFAFGRSVTVIALCFTSLLITGGILDPMHWFVPALFSNQWNLWWVWTFGPMLGAVLGIIIFSILVFVNDEKRSSSLWWKASSKQSRSNKNNNYNHNDE